MIAMFDLNLVVRAAFVLVLSSALAAPSASANETVYRWTDQSGVTQYTQTPPPEGRPYEVIRAGTRAGMEGESAEGTRSSAGPSEPAAAPVAGVDAETQRRAYCEQARRNVETLSSKPVVYRASSQDGESRILTPEEQTTELEAARRQVVLYCRE